MGARLTAVRIVGGLALGFIAWLVVRGLAGPALATGVAILVAGLGIWFLPRTVLLRVIWTLPLFALLLFVSVQLMFHVPGDPFASEKKSTPAVWEQQKALYGIPEKSFVGGCDIVTSLHTSGELKQLLADAPKVASQQ